MLQIPFKFEMFLGWQALIAVSLIFVLSLYYLFIGQVFSALLASCFVIFFIMRIRNAKAVNSIAQEMFRKLIEKDPS